MFRCIETGRILGAQSGERIRQRRVRSGTGVWKEPSLAHACDLPGSRGLTDGPTLTK